MGPLRPRSLGRRSRGPFTARRLVLLSATLLVACGSSSSSSDPAASPKVASDDERGTVGVPNPAYEYCVAASGTVVTSDGGTGSSLCTFPDGTACELFAFFRASCGKQHSYCAQHGGTVESIEEDAGTFTAVVAKCHLGGVTCAEADFAKTHTCAP